MARFNVFLVILVCVLTFSLGLMHLHHLGQELEHLKVKRELLLENAILKYEKETMELEMNQAAETMLKAKELIELLRKKVPKEDSKQLDSEFPWHFEENNGHSFDFEESR